MFLEALLNNISFSLLLEPFHHEPRSKTLEMDRDRGFTAPFTEVLPHTKSLCYDARVLALGSSLELYEWQRGLVVFYPYTRVITVMLETYRKRRSRC